MIILDTNVLSELMKSQPNKLVLRWIGTHKATDLFITALTKAEILYGLEILPEGKRRTALKQAATYLCSILILLDVFFRLMAMQHNNLR